VSCARDFSVEPATLVWLPRGLAGKSGDPRLVALQRLLDGSGYDPAFPWSMRLLTTCSTPHRGSVRGIAPKEQAESLVDAPALWAGGTCSASSPNLSYFSSRRPLHRSSKSYPFFDRAGIGTLGSYNSSADFTDQRPAIYPHFAGRRASPLQSSAGRY